MNKTITDLKLSQEKKSNKTDKTPENYTNHSFQPNPKPNPKLEPKPNFLNDVSPTTGKKRDWDGKKQRSTLLAESFYRLSLKDAAYKSKAFRVWHCGDWLHFDQAGDIMKLRNANFCKDPLCPTCNWRRSLKNYGILSQVMAKAKEEKYKFLFLTLTIRNCKGGDLKQSLKDMLKGWQLLQMDRTFKKAVKGWVRSMEITHNLKRGDKFYNTFHPHLHIVLAVRSSYFTSKAYIKQKSWTELWKKKMALDYDPQVYIEKVKNKGKGRSYVNEMSKYVVKDSDMLIDNDTKLTDETVSYLSKATYKRRMIEYGGRLRQIKKELGLMDNDNLIDTNQDDDTELDPELESHVIIYHWNVGYKRYVQVHS